MPSQPPPDVLSLGELAALRSKAEWVVQGLVPAGSFILMAGPPKLASKTYKALHLAECVALGRPFLGLRTKPRRVLYVALEDGVERMKIRAHQLGIAANDPIGVTMFFGRIGLGLAIERLNNTSDPVLLIVDPLINWLTMAGVKDENDPTQIAPFIEQYRAIAQRSQSSILVTDHFDKAWIGMRGSSAKNGSSDGWLDVRPVGNDGQGLTRVRSILRDGKPIEVGCALTTTPHACEQCSDWDSPDDRVQIRLEARDALTMPVRYQPTATQEAGNGQGQEQQQKQRKKREPSPERAARIAEDKSLIIAVLAKTTDQRMTTAALVDKLPGLSEARVRAALDELVAESSVLPPRGFGPTALGFRLASPAPVITAPPVEQPSTPASVEQPVEVPVGPAGPAEQPIGINGFEPPTADEVALFAAGGADKMKAISTYSSRAKMRGPDAIAILKSLAETPKPPTWG